MGLGTGRRSRRGGPAVGLCWGSRLALAAVDPGQGQWRLRAAHSEPLSEDLDAQTELLSRWVSRAHLRRSPTVLTLTPGTYNLVQMERPAVPAEELNDALRWRIRDLLDYPLEEAVTGAFELPNQGRASRTPLVYVVAARSGPLREMVGRIHAAGLRVWKIDVAELALRNLAEREGPATETVAGIYLMPDRGMVQITRGETLYLSRSLDYGLDALGGADRVELYERVALELQRTMDYYDSHFGAAPVKRLLVMPGDASLSAMAEALGSSLGLPARLWQPGEHASADLDPALITSDGLLALGGALSPPGDAS